MARRNEETSTNDDERAKFNAANMLTEAEKEQEKNKGRIIPLEALDRKYTYADTKVKFTLRGEGARSFTDKSNKKIEYNAGNGLVIKGSAKFNDADKTYSMDIPILAMGRFLDWLEKPENCEYFNSLLDEEIKRNTGVSHRVPRAP